jgi:hypothetical protein
MSNPQNWSWYREMTKPKDIYVNILETFKDSRIYIFFKAGIIWCKWMSSRTSCQNLRNISHLLRLFFFPWSLTKPLPDSTMGSTVCVLLETGTAYPSWAAGFLCCVFYVVCLRSMYFVHYCLPLWYLNSRLPLRFSLIFVIYLVDAYIVNEKCLNKPHNYNNTIDIFIAYHIIP